jgi:hypothetical protein
MPLSVFRTAGLCRLAAALVALSLSGAPRAALALRPERPHRCQCAAHGEGHRCACRVCAEQARRARRSALEKVPPCHRALAERELAAEEERARAPSAPCLMPSCGSEAPPAATPPPAERFTLGEQAPLALADRSEPLPRARARAAELPAVPDVPPPRVA